jgi:hypothetical protein
MAPDASGHPLAPMEYVYECEEPKRRSFWERLAGLSLGKKLSLGVNFFVLFMIARGLIYLFSGADITG